MYSISSLRCNYSNVSKTTDSTGINIVWRVYANDTSGNLGTLATEDSVLLTNLVPAQVTGEQVSSNNVG